jgi:hypothetical protein
MRASWLGMTTNAWGNKTETANAPAPRAETPKPRHRAVTQGKRAARRERRKAKPSWGKQDGGDAKRRQARARFYCQV